MLRFVQERVNGYYGPGEVANFSRALGFPVRLFGRTPAVEFGPQKLKACREEMIKENLSRGVINKHVTRIRNMFRWANEEELLDVSVYQRLVNVEGLKGGRSKARDTKPVEPVSDAAVDATLPFLPPIVADMVRLPRLTGCRPGELCSMRPADVQHGR